MKINIHEFEKVAETKKKSEVYTVSDLYMKKLTVSKTLLHPKQHTSGHSHDAEEVYFVLEGSGELKLDDEIQPIKKGDLITIDANKFHQVFNESDEGDLIFLCVFEKYGDRSG